MFAASLLSIFMQELSQVHFEAAKRVYATCKEQWIMR